MAGEATEIKTISDAELNDLLNLAGPDNVITPIEESASPLRKQPDVVADALTTSTDDKIKEDIVVETTTADIDDALKIGADPNEEIISDDADKNTEIKKSVFFDAVQELVKDESIYLFEAEEGKEEKPLEQYSKKELIELFKSNIERVREEEQAKVPEEFFNALPEKLQYAAKYVMDGGDNLEGLFLSLAQAAQTEALDPATESGQEQIVRRWLQTTQFGTAEEIEEEVNGIKDRKELDKKAQQFKPKLDAKQQQVVEKQIKDQELRRKQQEVAAIKYREDVLKALQPADLNGIKLTPTLQGMLYNGLTQFNYQSVTGRPTNMLGHLLEQHQYVKPDPALISEALWLLKDPKAYRDAVKAAGNKEVVVDTVKKLKTESSNKATSTNLSTVQNGNGTRKTIQRSKTSIFARPK